jgi:hypothetical protein
MAVVLAPLPAHADWGGRCEAGICDVDQGPHPWLLDDACRDESDVVGHRRCEQFAEWSATNRDPELTFAGGVAFRHIYAPPPVVIDPVSHVARTVAASSRPMADIASSEFRFLGGWRSLYFGGELSVGDLTGKTYPYGAFIQSGGVTGVAVALGPFDLAAEAMVGGRSVRLTTNINRLAPAFTEVVIEARARAALWVTPWITLEAEIGAGVLDRSEWVAAAMVGLHTRAFGGRR